METTRLTPADRAALVRIVRETLERRLRSGAQPQPAEFDVAVSETLREPRGAFVSIYNGHELRGCRGRIGALRPLHETVMEQVVNSALDDHRFTDVTAKELPDLRYSISVLTPRRAIDGPGDIVLGRDGVILEKDGRRAVFLPQVATQAGWDVETLLTRLALKAGLPADAWHEGAQLSVFEAEIVEG